MDSTKRQAVIFDVDGTLALICDRSPYDGSKALQDKLNAPVAALAKMASAHDYFVIVCSGREDRFRGVTEQFLKMHNVPFDLLLMRQTRDFRKDSVIKRELYETFIAPHYEVLFVVDDRLQVVRMWVELGLFVFNVNQTMEEF